MVRSRTHVGLESRPAATRPSHLRKLRSDRGSAQCLAMSADYLIALDRAQTELGDLYTVARRYRRLERSAELEMLPALTNLGMKLRALRRHQQWDDESIAAAARELHALRDTWRDRLDAVRTTGEYLDARRAYSEDDQRTLARLLPEVFAELEVVAPPARLHFAMRVSAPRRQAGDAPFLTADECCERLQAKMCEGITPLRDGTLGDEDFPSVIASDDPFDLDTPVSLVQSAADTKQSVFMRSSDAQLLIFTPRLRGPFTVCLCGEWDDSWWDASDTTYAAFRDEVAARLRNAGQTVSIATAVT